ncbi:hypothetical protein HYDPIDRAFT_148811 [Hydnomerulius pinastri MD-312]|nr:hypothetical protein HYDPIDRAFT_148811 [Hydnomerulius pinastri MD-312]
MFPRASALLVLILAAVASAHRSRPTRRTDSSSCDTGSLQCCNSVTNTNEKPGLGGLLSMLGFVTDATTGLGLGCSPISAIGTGQGAVCQQQPVCCSNNDYTGLVNIGCSPINLNL